MNEIHEFMSKFREGVEVIWGVAIDNSLDTKVKITVLATGFGVEDVPGMDSLHAARSQEEEERQLQLEEEKEKNKDVSARHTAKVPAISEARASANAVTSIFSTRKIWTTTISSPW
mgnify:CR=1 FL=1